MSSHSHVRNSYPELEKALDNNDALEKLIEEAAKEAWHAIDERVLCNLCDTMPSIASSCSGYFACGWLVYKILSSIYTTFGKRWRAIYISKQRVVS